MDNSKTNSLPIMKHFEGSQISNAVDSFRKGEWTLFTFIKFALLCAVSYLSWVYVLPAVFIAIGQTLAVVATGIIIVATIIMLPLIIKGIRRLTRAIHKLIIKHDPFAELEDQKVKMLENKKRFQNAKAKIVALKNDMETSAAESEKNAKKLEKDILALHAKIAKNKAETEQKLAQNGPSFKSSDEYVELRTDYQKIGALADRLGNKLDQEKTFVKKYGIRGNVMQKMGQKLLMVETSMDIKIDDFDATIEILKKDYVFAQKSREATQSAKEAMLFSKSWELEYALDVVTSTIAHDIAISASNFNDIDMLTSTYNMDSDELYTKLDLLADAINTGKDPVMSAKEYAHPEYKLTHEDKTNSGGFGELF